MNELSNLTYWKIGGICENFQYIHTTNELSEYLKKEQSFPLVIGNGTNILFDSRGYDGNVIRLGKDFNSLEFNLLDQTVVVGASVWIPGLVRTLSTKGLGGLEHCIGIPATMGGLVTMNGGSNRQSISEAIVEVYCLDRMGNSLVFKKSECNFGYRESIFKNRNLVITAVKIKLITINRNDNRSVLLKILKSRREKFPRKLPNCGSVFKSSPELFERIGPPGFVIESLGLKGLKIGGAEISNKHANFIVNVGNAKSSDIIDLVRTINKKCFETYGLKMKTEVIYYSKDGKANQLDEV